MPRFKDYNYAQTKMLPVSFERQILPGTFEYSLAYLVEHELDLRGRDAGYPTPPALPRTCSFPKPLS